MKRIAIFFIMHCAVVLALACKGKSDSADIEVPKKKLVTKTDDAKTDEGTVSLVISGNDAMQFDKKVLKVKAGAKVKLTLRHTGRMPVNVMGHNVVILNKDVNVNAFGSAASVAKATDYIPQDFKDKIIAYTPLIGGGQTTSVTFEAPEVGTYTFICSFPGHYALMRGTFTVE